MEAYFEAKMRLFEEVLEPGATAVVWADDPKSDEVIARARARGLEVLTRRREGRDAEAASRASRPSSARS